MVSIWLLLAYLHVLKIVVCVSVRAWVPYLHVCLEKSAWVFGFIEVACGRSVVNIKGCLYETLVCHGWPGTDRHGKLINTSPTFLVLLTSTLVIPIPFPDQASALPTAGTTFHVPVPKFPLLPLAPFTMNNQSYPNSLPAFPKLEPPSMSPTLPSLYSHPQLLTHPCSASVSLMTATVQHSFPPPSSSILGPTHFPESTAKYLAARQFWVETLLRLTCVYRTLTGKSQIHRFHSILDYCCILRYDMIEQIAPRSWWECRSGCM